MKEEVTDIFNHLIDMAADGEQGYKNAAEDVEDPDLKILFNRFSSERAEYVRELQQEVRSMGGNPDDHSGGPVGALHRVWMDMKSVFTSGDTDAIIDACISGEESAINGYTDALNNPHITGSFRDLLTQQKNGIETALMSIKAHRETFH